MEIRSQPSLRIRRTTSGSLAVPLMLAVVGFAPVAAAQSDPKAASPRSASDVDETWRSLFKQAALAFEEHRFSDAKTLLTSAAAIKMTPRILANLAQVENQLGEHRAAASHAAEALEALGSNPGIEEDLSMAAKQLGKLAVRVNVEGAKIVIDHAEIGLSPLTRPVYLDPGSHNIEASKAGYTTETRTYVAEKASEQSFDIELQPAPPGSFDPAEPASPSFGKSVALDASGAGASSNFSTTKPNPILLVAGGVVALGGMVTGIYLNSKANSEADQANGLNAPLGRDGCSHPGSSQLAPCTELMDHRASHDRARNWSSVGFVVGGAALLGTALYWFWPRGTTVNASAAQARLRVQMDGRVAPGESWLGLAAQF